MKSYGLGISLFITTFLLLSLSTFNPPRESNVLRRILSNLQEYLILHPQQKVYLHLDKAVYNADEIVWFKAYILNATTHRPDSTSSNLYLDLINPGGYVVQKKILKIHDGFAHGDFSFRDTVPEGTYSIVAYTNWMKNAGQDFFFRKNIYVKNPDFKNYASKDDVRLNKKSRKDILRKAEQLEVDFMPEGGSLLAGIENRIAFKAINELGRGTDIEGGLWNDKNQLILNFKSEFLGMGSFYFTPEKNTKYYVQIKWAENKSKKINLPQVVEKGIGLRADYPNDHSLEINIIHNFSPDNFPINTSYYLIIHNRGQAKFAAETDLKKGPGTFIIPSDSFSNGIVHISLFDSQMSPVSERLVFIYHDDPQNSSMTLSKPKAGEREKVDVSIELLDKNNFPVRGNLSLSVAKTDQMSNERDIRSDLLLNSDLKGGIENPSWYFANFDRGKLEKLDLVMLTNGWRRFEWNDVMHPPYENPLWPVEKGLEVSGQITRQFFGIPLKDIPVKMTIVSSFNDTYSTRSGPKGYFTFKNLDYSDTIEVRIEAQKENGSKNLLIWIEEQEWTNSSDYQYYSKQVLTKAGALGRFKPVEEPAEDDPFYEENNRIYRIHSEPRDVIIVDESMRHYQNIAQIIQGRIPGVSVTGDRIIIRGINTFYGSTDPLFLLDGIPIDASSAMMVNPNDIERIEILKGPDAAIYGVRGANGVIAIYTRRGKFMLKGVLDFKMLGYATPKEFYSPRYDLRADMSIPDERTTLFWEPNLMTNSNGEAKEGFFTSDVHGNFSVILEGISNKGDIIHIERGISIGD